MNRLPFPTVIDSTMRATFFECPQKFYWSFIRKLGPKEPSADLMAGGTFAHALETIRRLYYVERQPADLAIQQGLAAAIVYWGDFEVPEHKQQKSLERVLLAIGHYFSVWPLGEDKLIPVMWDGGDGIEFRFSLPMEIHHPETGEPIVYAGRSDMIANYLNQLWVVDEKTTSQLGASWSNKWNLRSQFTGYCHAARSFGLPVAGTIVRGISFLKNSFGDAEVITTRPEWMIDRWWEQLHYDVERMIHSWQSGRWDYALDEACNAYGGCAFTRLCMTNTPEEWVDTHYAPRHWNPLDKVPSGKPEATSVVEMQEVMLPPGVFR